MKFLVELLTKWDLDPELIEILVKRELERDFSRESLEQFVRRLRKWLYVSELYFIIINREQSLYIEQMNRVKERLKFTDAKLELAKR
jgi:hypothetical protein